MDEHVSARVPAIGPRAAISETPWAIPAKAASIQVQSVLYNAELSGLRRAVESIARAAELAISACACSRIRLSWGDCSSMPCLQTSDLDALRSDFESALEIEYHAFNRNLGSAAGHNWLAAAAQTDFILVQNPDVIVSPRLFERLLEPFRQPMVGMSEAKQLPIEHPKDYDRHTGETSWATTASALIPLALFRSLGGFDPDSFFLYCDDVDYSWRTRLAGYKVIFQPAAVVFHDKRLTDGGQWNPSSAERYYSAEAALFLTYKWSRSDLAEKILAEFEASDDPDQVRAASTFRRRRQDGHLPVQLDPSHSVGQFTGIHYARHRYPL